MRLAALTLCLLLVTGCAEVDLCGFDLTEELKRRVGRGIDLHELTSFEWDEVRLYGEYAPSQQVRNETGLTYHPARHMPQDNHVPEGHAFVAFMRNGRGVCGEHYNLYEVCLIAGAEGGSSLFQVASHCEPPR